MARIRFILILILATFTSSGSSDNKVILPVTENYPIQPKTTLFGQYKTKPPKALFYYHQWIRLNKDSTFSYRAESCLGIDTSYGNWEFTNPIIILKTSEKLRKEANKQSTLDNKKLVDLNNRYILTQSGYLLLQAYGNELDTLDLFLN